MSRRCTPIAFLAALMFLLGSGLGAGAQTVTLPVTPDPSACDVATLPTIQDILTRAGMTPAPDSAAPGATPSVSPTPFALPAGTPADQATIDSVTATLVSTLACQNTGHLFATFAFTTDNFIKTSLSRAPLTESDVATINELAATPTTVTPAQFASLVSVDNVTTLSDGRVGAVVGATFSQSNGETSVEYLIFAHQNGHWLIDEEIQDISGLNATPAA